MILYTVASVPVAELIGPLCLLSMDFELDLAASVADSVQLARCIATAAVTYLSQVLVMSVTALGHSMQTHY